MQLSPDSDDALLALLDALAEQDYAFVPPTPETHRRVVSRPDKSEARNLRDIFGWSLPFAPGLIAPGLLDLLERGGAIEAKGSLLRSKLRVSSLNGGLFLHSAFPTDAADSVFFGPDSYRFADFLHAELPRVPNAKRLVDVGCGAGVGAIAAAPLLPKARLTLADINRCALKLAAVNARHAGLDVEIVESDAIAGVAGPIDLAIANPPYIVDSDGPAYRDGGDMHGARLSLDWALAVARRLEAGGRMLLYTGAAIVGGRDALRDALERALPPLGCRLRYREIDPDVFGDELDNAGYAEVERIAVVGAVIEKN